MIKILYENCIQGEAAYNEDSYGYTESCAWVIDGATDVFGRGAFGGKDEVARYVAKLSDMIGSRCFAEKSLKNILKDSVSGLYSEMASPQIDLIDECELPTFAISFLRIRGTYAEFLILGDCSISYLKNNAPVLLTDTRIADFSKINREKLKVYLDEHGHVPEDKAIFRDTRSKINLPEGYPIGSVRGTGIMSSMVGRIRIKKGDRLIMFSDGLLDYIKADRNRLGNFFDAGIIDSELERMNAFLEDEEQYNNAPRPKKKDDCTILLMEV